MDFYHKSGIIVAMRVNYNSECEKVGYGLFCYPCPIHPQEKHDRLVFNKFAPQKDFFWTCCKNPLEYRDSFPGLTTEEIEELWQINVPRSEIQKTRVEIIARHILSNAYIISIKNGEKYALFQYYPEKGKYELTGRQVMEVEIQRVHSEIFGDELMTTTLASNTLNTIAEKANRGSDMSIFDNDDGQVYYISFRDKDIRINRKTGEMEVLGKDPENRPFLSALPYTLSELTDTEMPTELRELLELVAPTHRDELLLELASPLAFQGSRRIFLNFSRVGATGKTTLLHRIEELYSDLVYWGEPDALSERFEKSALLGKSALLIDEYEGGGYSIRRQLKNLASGNSLRVEVKHGPILSVKNRLSIIINSNNLQFDFRDDALLSRLSIVPFIKNFKESRNVEPWSEDVKRKIIWYLLRNVVPKYFLKEPKTYPIESLKKWCEDSMEGYKPDDGVEDFLISHMYRHMETHGLVITPEEAYRYYLLWTGYKQIIPLTQKEFLEKVDMLAKRDNAWIIDGKMSLKTQGLELFMK